METPKAERRGAAAENSCVILMATNSHGTGWRRKRSLGLGIYRTTAPGNKSNKSLVLIDFVDEFCRDGFSLKPGQLIKSFLVRG